MCGESAQVLRKMHRLKFRLSFMNRAGGSVVPYFAREGINKRFKRRLLFCLIVSGLDLARVVLTDEYISRASSVCSVECQEGIVPVLFIISPS